MSINDIVKELAGQGYRLNGVVYKSPFKEAEYDVLEGEIELVPDGGDDYFEGRDITKKIILTPETALLEFRRSDDKAITLNKEEQYRMLVDFDKKEMSYEIIVEQSWEQVVGIFEKYGWKTKEDEDEWNVKRSSA